MVVCPRCHRDADTLLFVPPDMMTRDLIESIEGAESTLAGSGDVLVCTACMDELNRPAAQGG